MQHKVFLVGDAAVFYSFLRTKLHHREYKKPKLTG